MQNTAKTKSPDGRAARGATILRDAAVPHAQIAGHQGRLILVTSADIGRLDLLMQAVGRRLNGTQHLAFVQPVVTQLLPAGGGAAITRSAFGALDRAGALALVWQHHGRSFGHSVSLLARLASGETVVAGAHLEAEARAREIWPDVKIIRLETGTERLRSGLSPRACLSRVVGAKDQGPPLTRLHSERFDVRLRDTGDIGITLRELAATILRQQPPAPTVAGVLGKPRTQRSQPVLGEALSRPKGAKRTHLPTGAGLAPRTGKPQDRALPTT